MIPDRPPTPANKHVLDFLASFAPIYKHEHFAPRCRDVGLDVTEVTTASNHAFLRLFFRHYGFNRAGGARAGYPDIALDALGTVDDLDPDGLWDAFVDGCDDRGVGLNERVNRGVVRDTTEHVHEKGNLIAWVGDEVRQTGSVEPAYETIRGIPGIGEKIARFFIRDAVWLTGVEPHVPPAECQYLQPMDVWTRRVARLLWDDLDEASDARISNVMADACIASDVSNAALNQGAWFYGAKELDGDEDALARELNRRLNG